MTRSIGQRIQEVFEESGMSKKDFADKLCTTRSNLYAIFKKDNIDVESLLRISKVLNHDFLQEYMEEKPERKNVFYGGKWITESEFGKIGEEREKADRQRTLQLANAYFADKKKHTFYNVNFITEFNESVDWEVPLSSDEIETLRQRIIEEDSYLTDVLDWEDKIDIKEWGWGEIVEVVSVDFTPINSYVFTCCELKSPDSQPRAVDFFVDMTDSQYIRLLTMVMRSRYLTVAELEQQDSELYHLIMDSTRRIKWLLYPFVVFMKEVQQDVKNMIGDIPVDEDEQEISDDLLRQHYQYLINALEDYVNKTD